MNRISNFLIEKRRLGLKETINEKEKNLLSKGFPIQKIIGFINFDDLDIYVNRKVLIPRYETFELIQLALKYIKKESKVLDLGCGSGYIGLTIKQKTYANVTLSDIDEEAIIQTKQNAKKNNLDVRIIKSDLFENIKEKFDFIVCNPPYIPENKILDNSVINFEPHHALFSGKDGNNFYQKLLSEVENHINKKGFLIMEISPDNKLFLEKHNFLILKDINKKERIAIKQF